MLVWVETPTSLWLLTITHWEPITPFSMVIFWASGTDEWIRRSIMASEHSTPSLFWLEPPHRWIVNTEQLKVVVVGNFNAFVSTWQHVVWLVPDTSHAVFSWGQVIYWSRLFCVPAYKANDDGFVCAGCYRDVQCPQQVDVNFLICTMYIL